MAVAPNPFDEVFIRANLSYQLLPHTRSGSNSAEASVAANDSSASLIHPMLDGNDGKQEIPAAAESASTSTSPSPGSPAHQQQKSIEDIANAPALVANTRSSLNYEVRKPGQKPMKTVAPIRVPRRSEPGNGSQNGLRSPATGLSSAALTSSFPMPPPRTPCSHSPGTFGSPSTSGHGHSHEDSLSSPPRTSSNSPQNTSQRQSPVQDRVPQLPRKMLSVPPPTPALTTSRTSSSLGLYWEGEISSIRNSGSHPAPSAVLPYYSPNPLANPLTPFREEAYARHRSFAAEMSTPLPSGPPSPMYPPRTYSPGGASDVSRKEYAQLAGSPPTHEGALAHFPNGRASRPSLYRNPSSTSQEWESKSRRRESIGTFVSVFLTALHLSSPKRTVTRNRAPRFRTWHR